MTAATRATANATRAGHDPRCSTRAFTAPDRRVIESQSVRLSANFPRPERRSTDGQAILKRTSGRSENRPDLLFCGAPLRNRTVDLLLTMDRGQVPLSRRQDRPELRVREHRPALASAWSCSKRPVATQSATQLRSCRAPWAAVTVIDDPQYSGHGTDYRRSDAAPGAQTGRPVPGGPGRPRGCHPERDQRVRVRAAPALPPGPRPADRRGRLRAHTRLAAAGRRLRRCQARWATGCAATARTWSPQPPRTGSATCAYSAAWPAAKTAPAVTWTCSPTSRPG